MKILFWFIIQFFICYSSISQKRNGNLFEGMLYYAVNTGSSKSDTVILFVHQNKLLSIWNSKTFKKKGSTKRLIVIDDSTHEYWFQDKRKVILKGIPLNEFAKRNFALLNERDTIGGLPCLKYYSSYSTNDNLQKVTNTYKKAISVSADLNFLDEDTYLVNFFVYKGNFIAKIIDTFYFANGPTPNIVVIALIKIENIKPNDKLFELPSDYVIKPYSSQSFQELFIDLDEDEKREILKEIQKRKKRTYKIPVDSSMFEK